MLAVYFLKHGEFKMTVLNETEIAQVGGGLGPFAIIGIDLALNGVLIAYTALMTSDYMQSES